MCQAPDTVYEIFESIVRKGEGREGGKRREMEEECEGERE
jgi:hypothetical protein